MASTAKRGTDVMFFATLFTVTFTKLQWTSAHGMVLSDVFTAVFLAMLVVERLLDRGERIPRVAWQLLLIAGCLFAVYSTGFLSAGQIDGGPQQVAKGLTRLGLHFALLAGGVVYLTWRPRKYTVRAVGCLCAGVTANALYAAAQLAAHETGHNLDAAVVSPLTGRPARSLVFGLDKSPDVPRLTGLTMDPDHLAIMLIVPILILLSFYLRLETHDRRRLPTALLITALLLVGAATFSRSGLLGLAAGVSVIAWRERSRFWSRRVIAPLVAGTLVLAAVAAIHPSHSARIVAARMRVDHTSMSHVHQYEFVARALRTNAAFGIGLENFGRRYAPITGRERFGPHSLYLQSLAETGVIGTLALAVFLVFVARRLRGRNDPLAIGLAAVLVGTMAANVFYLTMTFYYFYALLILVFAAAEPGHSKRQRSYNARISARTGSAIPAGGIVSRGVGSSSTP